MQVQLSLSEESHLPFFFLGDNLKKLKVSLTFESPGPVTVDLTALTEREQAVLFNKVADGSLVCDKPKEQLYTFFRELQGQLSLKGAEKSSEEAVPVKEDKKLLLTKVIVDHKEKKKAVDEKIQHTVKGGVKAVLSVLKDEEDPQILLKYKRYELSGKKRATVLSYIETKLSKFHSSIVQNIETDVGNTNFIPTIPTTQYDNNVVEYDVELVEFAAGEPLTKNH